MNNEINNEINMSNETLFENNILYHVLLHFHLSFLKIYYYYRLKISVKLIN